MYNLPAGFLSILARMKKSWRWSLEWTSWRRSLGPVSWQHLAEVLSGWSHPMYLVDFGWFCMINHHSILTFSGFRICPWPHLGLAEMKDSPEAPKVECKYVPRCQEIDTLQSTVKKQRMRRGEQNKDFGWLRRLLIRSIWSGVVLV